MGGNTAVNSAMSRRMSIVIMPLLVSSLLLLALAVVPVVAVSGTMLQEGIDREGSSSGRDAGEREVGSSSLEVAPSPEEQGKMEDPPSDIDYNTLDQCGDIREYAEMWADLSLPDSQIPGKLKPITNRPCLVGFDVLGSPEYKKCRALLRICMQGAHGEVRSVRDQIEDQENKAEERGQEGDEDEEGIRYSKCNKAFIGCLLHKEDKKL
eukprot:Nk52_evm71s745 gene=Nk52_evmTU71s745